MQTSSDRKNSMANSKIPRQFPILQNVRTPALLPLETINQF